MWFEVLGGGIRAVFDPVVYGSGVAFVNDEGVP